MRRFRIAGAFALVLAVVPPPPLRADPPAAATTRAKEGATVLVRQLGDRSFKVRERASRELVRMGEAAVAAVRAGLKDDDPEVRRRCEAILPRAIMWEVERGLSALLADSTGGPHHDLPGWARYRRTVGTDEPARRLLVDIIRAHGNLLRAVERDPDEAGGEVMTRLRALEQSPIPGRLSLTSAAALAFVSADPKVELDPLTRATLCDSLELGLADELAPGSRNESVRKLVAAFLSRCVDDGAAAAALRVAMRLKLKETLRMAVKELRLRKGTANSTALAALVVGERGGKKQIALLTPLLKDRTELGTFGTVTMSGTTEVGDVALASLVRLSGQSLAAYGFPAGDVAGYTWRTDGPRIVGFSAESQRLAAKRKWKAWAAGSKGE